MRREANNFMSEINLLGGAKVCFLFVCFCFLLLLYFFFFFFFFFFFYLSRG